ncbi:hypothetical protein J6590_026943 [Homalodisca vitripennis]|nr:hypothetical protein J6590_026943 [Homalodisca vitripennis]
MTQWILPYLDHLVMWLYSTGYVDDESDDTDDEYGEISESAPDEDPDIHYTAPQWSITTTGMRSIEFTRIDTLLVPIPGTWRQDRKLVPTHFKSAVLKTGKTITRYGNNVMIGKGHDIPLSTEHENKMVDFVNTR